MKKNITHIGMTFLGIAVVLLVASSGCNGKKKPADLPALYPCQITVMQDGKPLEGALVRLHSDKSLRFTTSGVTDNQGVANIKTDVSWPGAPEGKYKVCVQKVVTSSAQDLPKEVPNPTTDRAGYAEYRKKAAEIGKATSYVDKKFLRPNSTPVTAEVTTSGCTQTVDVGAAVNEPWDSLTKSSS